MNDAANSAIAHNSSIVRGPLSALCLVFHAKRRNATVGNPMIQRIVAYPITKLDNQRLQIKSPAFQPPHHATARPIANPRASGSAESHSLPALSGAAAREKAAVASGVICITLSTHRRPVTSHCVDLARGPIEDVF